MLSINSNENSTKVLNSRSSKTRPLVWRRRKGATGTIFTTYERPALSENKPIAMPDGGVDTFNIGRLIISIAAAFTHDQRAARYDSLWLAQNIEDKLSSSPDQLSTSFIAETTHTTLKQYDEIAAVQYAAKHQLVRNVRKRGRPSIK